MGEEDEDELAELTRLLGDDSQSFDASYFKDFSDNALMHFFDLIGDQRMITNVPSFVALRAEMRRRGLIKDDTRH